LYIKHDLDQFIVQHEEKPRIFIYLGNIILMQTCKVIDFRKKSAASQ
jgi:hypothetical protein